MMKICTKYGFDILIISGSYFGHRRHTTYDGRRTTPWVWHKLATGELKIKVFHTIWRECGKPSSGTVNENYKYAKKSYRKACRLAINHHINIPVVNINKLFSKQISRYVEADYRKTKIKPSETKDCITMDNLREYFELKFSNSFHVSDVIKESKKRVKEKCARLSDNSRFRGVTISEHKVKRNLKQLHSGTSPGMDGVRPEHLKYALNTDLPKYLAVLLTWCIRFGIVLDTLIWVISASNKKANFGPLYWEKL